MPSCSTRFAAPGPSNARRLSRLGTPPNGIARCARGRSGTGLSPILFPPSLDWPGARACRHAERGGAGPTLANAGPQTCSSASRCGESWRPWAGAGGAGRAAQGPRRWIETVYPDPAVRRDARPSTSWCLPASSTQPTRRWRRSAISPGARPSPARRPARGRHRCRVAHHHDPRAGGPMTRVTGPSSFTPPQSPWSRSGRIFENRRALGARAAFGDTACPHLLPLRPRTCCCNVLPPFSPRNRLGGS